MAVELLRDVARLNRLDVAGRRVFVRCDLSVPLSPQGAVLDDAKLRLVLPTLRHLISHGAKVIIATELGTPDAPASPPAEEALAQALRDLLGQEVTLLGAQYRRSLPFLKNGDVAVFPNLLRIDGELVNDPGAALQIAQGIDVYVNEAFAESDRSTMSLTTLPRLMPSRGLGAAAAMELSGLARAMDGLEHRFTAMIGGGSLAEKAPLIRALVPHVDAMLFGGVVANTLLAARGWPVGASRVDTASLSLAASLDRDLQTRGVEVVLPTDVVVADVNAPAAPLRTVPAQTLGPSEAIVDLGADTILEYRRQLVSSYSVLWNGLLGTCDRAETRDATERLAQFAIESSKVSFALGPSTTRAVRYLNLERYYDFVSRGGELALAVLAGAQLPALEALRQP